MTEATIDMMVMAEINPTVVGMGIDMAATAIVAGVLAEIASTIVGIGLAEIVIALVEIAIVMAEIVIGTAEIVIGMVEIVIVMAEIVIGMEEIAIVAVDMAETCTMIVAMMTAEVVSGIETEIGGMKVTMTVTQIRGVTVIVVAMREAILIEMSANQVVTH